MKYRDITMLAQQSAANAQINAVQNQYAAAQQGMANNSSGISPYLTTNTSGLSASSGWNGFRSTGMNKQDLDHPLYDVPLSTLKDLWGAKFGTRWVSLEELEELDDLDKSWLTTFRRLRAMVMLENANTIDTNRQLYRLPPE